LCAPGRFGKNCHSKCSEGCLTCDFNGSCTMWAPGYIGIKDKCPGECLDDKCDKWTGHAYNVGSFTNGHVHIV
jgi:hypothetical protein